MNTNNLSYVFSFNELNSMPGKIFIKEDEKNLYIKWEPGNCTTYRIFVTEFSQRIADDNGGNRLVTFGFPDNLNSIILCNQIGMCHVSYFAEKIAGRIKSKTDILLLCALLNLVVYGNIEYASECINEANLIRGSIRIVPVFDPMSE